MVAQLARKPLREDTAVGAELVVQGLEGTKLQTFEYDGLSRVTRSTDDNGGAPVLASVVTSSYDSLSRKRTESQGIGSAPVRTVACEYDQNSNMTQLTYPGRIGGGTSINAIAFEAWIHQSTESCSLARCRLRPKLPGAMRCKVSSGILGPHSAACQQIDCY